MDFDPGDPRNNPFRAPPASTTPRAYSGDGSIKGSVFAPSSGFADPDTVRGNSVSMSADTDFLDNPFRPSNSVFEPAPWFDQFNQLWYDYFNDRDPADDFDDFDRIEREQEANRLLDLLEEYGAGTIGYEQFMAEYNTGDTFNEIPGFDEWLKESRDAVQYDSMLNDWSVVSKSDDPEAIQDFVSLYNRTGIEDNSLVQADLASTGSATSVITGTVDNSIIDAAVKKAAMGDGILGGTVDLSKLPGYGGIWEGLIRHIEVMVKGIGLPIPDWLPLPGIFELPTVGEIFDKVTGPWKTASEDALRECVATGKSASQCMEEQSVIDILVDGIGNATEGVWNATKDKVNEIIAEGGECLGDPKTCAKEVFDKIKDIFGEGAVDPTSTGGNIPDWMKVIIIGGAYGDEILGELEDLFGGDIDGDDLVGPPEDPTVTPPVTAEFDCAGVFKNGGKVTDESQCGGCLEGYDPDGQGGCTVAPIDCGAKVWNEATGECEDPDPGFVEGDPCKTEGGDSGTYDADGACVADAVEPTPCINNATQESGCEECADGSLPSEHQNGDCKQPEIVTQVECPQNTPKAGQMVDKLSDCGAPTNPTGYDCNKPKPAGYTFDTIAWEQNCGGTHCTDGTLKDDAEGSNCPGYVAPEVTDPEDPEEECAKPDGTPTGATVASGCEQCPDGYTFDFDGICQPDGGSLDCAQYNRETLDDGTCGGCLPGFQKDTSLPNEPCVATFDGCPAGYELVNGQCAPIVCPEGQEFCESSGSCEEPQNCEGGPSEGGGGRRWWRRWCF